ncbi:MAG: hypothetical protein IJA32_06570 [Lachnospiraceae bacterium]|nr:hypothetical protein [Lachnospiraceae bacterium]
MKEIECAICGSLFNSCRNAIVCSEKCRKIRRKQMMKICRDKKKEEKSKNESKKMELSQAIQEAHECGMSYGKYMAMRNGYLL